MNTPVNFQLGILLKQKGFDGKIEQGYYLPHPDVAELNNVERNVWILLPYNPLLNQVIAPTIAEVVMWLYEKHGIWVSVTFKRHSQNKHFSYNIRQANGIETYLWEHNSPTEAYEAAIEYALNNLI